MIATIITSFRTCTFSNLKWYGLILAIILVLEYASALANFSPSNSPSVFPTPFNDRGIDRPLSVPIYREFGSPLTELVKEGPEQGELRPTKWAFYFGFLISEGRLQTMWLDWFVIVLINYFFIHFYSVAFEYNMKLDSNEAIQKSLQRIEDEAEESVRQFAKDSNKGSLRKNNSIQGDDISSSFQDPPMLRKSTKNLNDANDYVEKIRKSMFLHRFYYGVSIAVCSTSSIISLVCLLMISFQIRGIINLIYICFCLYFISKAINFIYQRGWTFPYYLKNVLKPIVIIEIFFQFAYQVPITQLHSNENNEKGWQRIIGFRSIWQLDSNHFPESIDVYNLVLKTIMYAFILLQQNIFKSAEYKVFINSTLVGIRNLSDMKAEAMAYLYNNFKIKTTIQNQFEKDKMMKKLAKVNKQLKKWNQTVFTKSEGAQDENLKKIKQAMEPKADEKIQEVPPQLEEDKENDSEEDSKQDPKLKVREDPKMHVLTITEKADARKKEDEYEDMPTADLVKHLTEDKLGLVWKLWILGTRYMTNQILLVFNIVKLEGILDGVRNGETRIYTPVERTLVQDYHNDKLTRDEKNLETIEEIPKEERSNLTAKATKGAKLLGNMFTLSFKIIVSNSAFVCYLLMIVAMIMNGSIVSMVYPFSVFIYALLEEKRPSKKYWLFVVYYSAIILVLKFLVQTYPLAFWLTNNFDENDATGDGNDTIPSNSANDFLRTIRLGIEVIEDGRNFVNFFLFEALILLSVTLHIFLQVFGGVWDEREIEKESIHEAAARIANIQRQERIKKKGKLPEVDSDEELLLKNQKPDVVESDFAQKTRRRAYSMNDCKNIRDVSNFCLIF